MKKLLSLLFVVCVAHSALAMQKGREEIDPSITLCVSETEDQSEYDHTLKSMDGWNGSDWNKNRIIMVDLSRLVKGCYEPDNQHLRREYKFDYASVSPSSITPATHKVWYVGQFYGEAYSAYWTHRFFWQKQVKGPGLEVKTFVNIPLPLCSQENKMRLNYAVATAIPQKKRFFPSSQGSETTKVLWRRVAGAALLGVAIEEVGRRFLLPAIWAWRSGK